MLLNAGIRYISSRDRLRQPSLSRFVARMQHRVGDLNAIATRHTRNLSQ